MLFKFGHLYLVKLVVNLFWDKYLLLKNSTANIDVDSLKCYSHVYISDNIPKLIKYKL